jgi:uncharacterized protein (TIRG00374 family)
MGTERATESDESDTRRLTRGLVLIVIASAILYAAFAFSADAAQVAAALKRFPLWILFAAMGLSFSNYVVRFVRWRLYCRRLGIALEPGASFLIHLSGLALTVSPGKMGEAFKSLLVRRVTGTPVAVSAPIVLAERFTDLLAFLLLIAIGASSSESGQAWIVWSTCGLCTALFVFVVSTRLQRAVLSILSKRALTRKFTPKIEEALVSSRTLLAPSALLLPTLIATAGWSLECLAFKLVAGAFVADGVPFLFAAYTFALAAVAGAVAFIFPGGLGVTEASMGALLRRRYVALGLGIEAAAASAVSATILIRLATLWFAVGVGIVAVLLFRRRHGGIT